MSYGIVNLHLILVTSWKHKTYEAELDNSYKQYINLYFKYAEYSDNKLFELTEITSGKYMISTRNTCKESSLFLS